MKCVYCFDFPDGKRYVGSTKDLERRMSEHRRPNNGKDNPDLKEAILQGGYEVIILEQCPDDYTKKQLEARETHYIGLWWDYGILYNKSKNASGGSNKGRVSPNKGIPMSKETKAKMSAARMGKPTRRKGKRYSPAWQHADEIRADRVAGMPKYALARKYKTGDKIINEILR